MYISTLYIPLLSAITSGLFGRYLGKKGTAIWSSMCISMTAVLAWCIFFEVGLCGCSTYVPLFTWIESGLFSISFGLCFDQVTVVMLVLVTTVSALVHIYSTEYMSTDPHIPRFMSYLSLFTFFMLILITADNILQLFIGWEGVGLCSYLLINFWYTRIQANKSAIKAMIVNRVGDIGLALAMLAIYSVFKTLDFSTIFACADQWMDFKILWLDCSIHAYTLIGLLLLIGCIGKSAQLGLHTWLPDAMEGPTPVSALIHAATMVTAGVFLLIRCSPILEYAPQALMVIVVVGALTAFFAASVGLVQNDIKRVIAYSTCSQLGYMVFACGISQYSASLFHLFNHGFFKALLFLSAGSVIHAMADEQDMRKLGGLIQNIPFTYSMMLIGSLSLMGFPFLTGFYSKDAILELAYAQYTLSATFAHWLGSAGAFLTAFYSWRLIYLTFLTRTNAPKHVFILAHESAPAMSLPLILLAFGSIFFGYIFKDMIIGVASPFFYQSIFVLPHHVILIEAEFFSPALKWIPVILSLFGAGAALFLYHFFFRLLISFKLSYLGQYFYVFFQNKWHWDTIYNSFIAGLLLRFGHLISYKYLDRGLLEFLGPTGSSSFLSYLSSCLSAVQSGLIYHYAFIIFISSTFCLCLLGGQFAGFWPAADFLGGLGGSGFVLFFLVNLWL